MLLLLFWLAVLALSPARAEDARPLKGVALVIGQSSYSHLPALANTGNDARAITQLLTALGFEARSVADRDAAKLHRDLERFAEDADGADVAILYYSGHGIEAGGENYLLPVDADLDALADAGSRLVPLSETIEQLKQKVPVTILLIDACRTSPFPPGALVKTQASQPGVPVGAIGLGTPKGAVPIEDTLQTDTLGIVIGYAAEPGRAALDGDTGGTSPYAAALIRHLSAMKGAEFGTVMRMVTEEVYLKTQGRQRPWVNESLRRLLYFGAVPEEPKGEEALITGERRQLLLTIAALPDAERRQVETVAKDGGIPLDALYGILRALGEQQMPQDPEALDKLLRTQAEKLKTIMAERQALATDDPEITRLAGAADRAIAEGAIATARQFLDQAVARVDATQGAVDQAEAKLKAKRLADASVYARRADAAVLASDYLAAAKDYQTAFGMAEKWDRALALRYKIGEGNALLDYGDENGSDYLKLTIEAFQQAAALAPQDRQSREWAEILTGSGFALAKLGGIERDMAKIEAGVTAFRQALAIRGNEKATYSWAESQFNLGSGLQALSEQKYDAAKLEEALSAFDAALGVWSRERYPLAWAQTQSMKGIVLGDLGLHQNGSARLGEAAAAFRAALDVRMGQSDQHLKAATLSNLGYMLWVLGEREKEPAKLEEAVAAYRMALAEDTRQLRPHNWANTQRKLGLVLYSLGGRSGNLEHLSQATTAFRAALEEIHQASEPALWTDIQYNLGLTLYKLGRRESGTARLEEAATSFREALKEQGRERPFGWARIQAGLGLALQTIGQRKSSAADLEAAIKSHESAIEGFKQAGATSDSQAAERQLVLTRALLKLVRNP